MRLDFITVRVTSLFDIFTHLNANLVIVVEYLVINYNLLINAKLE